MELKPFFKAAGVAIGIVSVLLVLIVAVAVGTGRLAGPVVWRFPQGYRGWVVVQYQNPACPPLAKEGMYLVISISASGYGCTSTPTLEGYRYTRYEYFDPNSQRTRIRADGWNTNSLIWPVSIDPKKRKEFLFVGTQEELNRSWRSRPD